MYRAADRQVLGGPDRYGLYEALHSYEALLKAHGGIKSEFKKVFGEEHPLTKWVRE